MAKAKKYDAKCWLDEIKKAKTRQEDFITRGEKVIQRYRDKRDKIDEGIARFNILYSNTETLKPLLFSNLPMPEARRRNANIGREDMAAVIRKLAEVLERAIAYGADEGGAKSAIKRARDDKLLPGRGVVRLCYKPVEDDTRTNVPVVASVMGLNDDESPLVELPEDAELDEDGNAYVVEGEESEKVFDEVTYDYVYWKNFLYGYGKVWCDVRWIAFAGYYTKEEIEEDNDFKAYAKKLSYAKPSKDAKQSRKELANYDGEVTCIYEIWCKDTDKQYFVADGFAEAVLHEVDDPSGLLSQDMFPTPEPLWGIKTNEDNIPEPLFAAYQDQAIELDDVTERISNLIDQVKYRGVYDAGMKEVPNVFSLDDGEFLPVTRYRELAEQGGLPAVVGVLPTADVVAALQALYQERDTIIQTIYEIIGLADIMRGKSDPGDGQETNKLKGKFGSIRISEQQREMQDYIRDLYVIHAELIAANFDAETLALMTGLEVDESMMEMLRDTYPRVFQLDVESEATIARDSEETKAQAVEFVSAMADFAEAVPGLAQVYGFKATKELLMTAFRQFKAGRQLEETFEEEIDKQIAIQEEKVKNPEPTPDMIRAKTDEFKAQTDAQAKQAELQVKFAEIQIKQMELQIEQGKAISDAQQKGFENFLAETELSLKALALKGEMQNPNDNAFSEGLN